MGEGSPAPHPHCQPSLYSSSPRLPALHWWPFLLPTSSPAPPVALHPEKGKRLAEPLHGLPCRPQRRGPGRAGPPPSPGLLRGPVAGPGRVAGPGPLASAAATATGLRFVIRQRILARLCSRGAPRACPRRPPSAHGAVHISTRCRAREPPPGRRCNGPSWCSDGCRGRVFELLVEEAFLISFFVSGLSHGSGRAQIRECL